MTKDAESYVTEVMKQLSVGEAGEVASSLILKQCADDAFGTNSRASAEPAGINKDRQVWSPDWFGDAVRQFDVGFDFLLIVGFWKQTGM